MQSQGWLVTHLVTFMSLVFFAKAKSTDRFKTLIDLGAGLASEPVKERVWQLDYVGNK